MRTIRTKLYSFEELNKEAQEVAIEEVRNEYYEYNDFGSWAVDTCALFEPKQEELDLIGFDSSKGFLIENTRESIYFDTDRNSFLDCANAMKITSNDLFLKWLGIPNECLENIHFSIFTSQYRNGDTTIDFDNYNSNFDEVIEMAQKKFNNHIKDILKRIETDIDYRFTDEAITEDILDSNYEFLSNGKKY